MKYLIALTALALFASPVLAYKTKTVSVTVSATKHGGGAEGGERCGPIIGNWVNASKTNCPSRGYGPSDSERSFTFSVEVPRKHKN